jgi:alkanesulfonate monooxygenase
MTKHATMTIGALFDQVGTHPAAWRHSCTPLGGEIDFSLFSHIARSAERGKFDFVFFADTLATRRGNMEVLKRLPYAIVHFEPVTLLSAVAAVTERIGLAATVSTSFSEPYNVARQFASIDHISGGRVGWNVVTTSDPSAALNFGGEQDLRGKRYERANEYVSVVNGLWDSWQDDAFVRDREAGIFFDPAKMHALNHKGEFFQVRGPLNIHRSPQGRPVIISAGGSDAGRDHAARTSEVVFAVNRDIAAAKAFYDDQKGRLAAYGRSPDDLRILSALTTYVGRTDEEALEKLESLHSHIHPDVGRAYLSADLGIDLTGLPIDEPIPAALLPESTNTAQAYFDNIIDVIRKTNPTLRELYEIYAASRGDINPVVGSPKTIADRMEEWFTQGVTDGFMLQIPSLPGGIDDFVSLVVPELQKRGLFRRDYQGSTLRDHLGLKRPTAKRCA